MKAVVTGGAGFIGSHVVEQLLVKGHHVTVVDNFSTGNRTNLEQVVANPKTAAGSLRVVEADINEDQAAAEFIGTHSVFHLAALADIVPSIEHPERYHRANVDGTVACLRAAHSAGVKRFVYAASSSCYGIPDTYPTNESAPAQPMYPYALTKYVGEQYVMHWSQVYGLPTVALRLFNVYGPRARTTGTYGAVFGVFLAQKLNGLPFTIVGDGTQTRDFTYVTDVARAFIAAAESQLSGEIMNVGSGNTYSVNELVERLGGSKTHIPKRPGEPDCTFADIAKIHRLLNWQPKVSFSEGVEVMLEHIEDWRSAPKWTVDRISEATKDWFKYLGGERT